MSGNVASVSLGTASHQFVKLANGNWQPTGGGAYEKLVQTNQRVPYEYKCSYTSTQPYAMSRGWDITASRSTYTTRAATTSTSRTGRTTTRPKARTPARRRAASA